MTGTEDNEKKGLEGVKKFYYIWLLPLYINFIYLPFAGLYLIAFGGTAQYGELNKHPAYIIINRGTWYTTFFMLFLLFLWIGPARKYMKKPSEELKKKLRRRIEKLYLHTLYFFGLSLALSLLTAYFRAGQFEGIYIKEVIPALLFSFIIQTVMTVLYVDNFIYKLPDLMELLYTKEELLSSPRLGYSIPFYLKISSLITACAIIPGLFVARALANGLTIQNCNGIPYTMLITCSFMLIMGMSFIFYGFQKPLNKLIERMREVSKGNYDMKSRIYFSDEIGRLKLGFNQMLDGLKEREELYSTFGKYLSIEIARELVKNKKVNLGGEEMEAAVMFCDIRNFTPVSEKMNPAEVVGFLNEYFHYITPPITEHKGIINKFMGDAVMAVYTPALGSKDYAKDAVNSALAMRKALDAFNSSGKMPFRVNFGIGLHAGKLIAGNIGTPARMEYTFIGDTVNAASRLQAKTKDFSCDIIASGNVVEALKKSGGSTASFESLGEVPLKGKSLPLEIYKLA